MKSQFVIGAPSLTGKGANEVAESIESMKFPCSLRVTNHMPRAAVFPESGVHLASTFASEGQSADVHFTNLESLRRLIRSASQVGELNGFDTVLTVEFDDGEPDADADLTAQVIAQAPELADEIKAAGGVDAAATLADEGKEPGDTADTVTDAPNGAAADTTTTESDTDSANAAAGNEVTDAPKADATTESAANVKPSGKRSKGK